MLTYSFQNAENESLYEYLYKCIKQDILSGAIAPGVKLPSKRSFAKNLGVSVITVENAYAQLVAEGYLYSVPKSGYYVENIREHLLTPAQEQEAVFFEKDDKRSVWTYDLVSGRTDPKQFPFTIWAKLLRENLSLRQEELMTNAPGAGIWQLRSAIAKYLMEYQGMNVDAQQIIVGAGTEYLYGLIIQLLGQDKIYALEDPGYTKTARIYESHLVDTVYIPMDPTGVDMNALKESAADVMHVSPSHQFPTGVTTPIGRRYELLSWANEKTGRYIIEDDYDCEFRLAGKPIPSLQSIDRQGKVIYMNTFTRSLASTIRISYMVLPGQLLTAFRKKLGFYACTVPNFEQYTLADFIGRGYFGKHINRVRNYYRTKRDALLETIYKSALASRCEVHCADAGLHFLLRLHTQLTDTQLTENAAHQGIRISCLSDYISGDMSADHYSGYVVINYSGIAREDFSVLIAKLEKAWL